MCSSSFDNLVWSEARDELLLELGQSYRKGKLQDRDACDAGFLDLYNEVLLNRAVGCVASDYRYFDVPHHVLRFLHARFQSHARYRSEDAFANAKASEFRVGVSIAVGNC